MALNHNAFVRAFNTIYQQAPRVHESADKTDFVGYCLAWLDCVATHHEYEEMELFPNIDRAAGRNGLMDSAVHEHEAFQEGLEQFRKYLLEKGSEFSGPELVKIMDNFEDPLHSHLKSEPLPSWHSRSTTPRKIPLTSSASPTRQVSAAKDPLPQSCGDIPLKHFAITNRQDASHRELHVQHATRLLPQHGD